MAIVRTSALRTGLRAASARPVTSQPLRMRGVRGIRTEKPEGHGEGMGGSESKSLVVPVTAGVLGIGAVFFFMLGTPEKAASVPAAPGSTADEIQRKASK
ncbi:hypothetical protein SUNI508_07228 [Seiridium unicorne]|uniref:Uncharacterized protein n=1 Tax=Seiridium unicorne TaxID=138068 RepID=A0ABR2UY03_9PEZI